MKKREGSENFSLNFADKKRKMVRKSLSGTTEDLSVSITVSGPCSIFALQVLGSKWLSIFMGKYLSFRSSLALSRTCKYLRHCFWKESDFVQTYVTTLLGQCYHLSKTSIHIDDESSDCKNEWVMVQWLPLFSRIDQSLYQSYRSDWVKECHGVSKTGFVSNSLKVSPHHAAHVFSKGVVDLLDFWNERQQRMNTENSELLQILREHTRKQLNENKTLWSDVPDVVDFAMHLKVASHFLRMVNNWSLDEVKLDNFLAEWEKDRIDYLNKDLHTENGRNIEEVDEAFVLTLSKDLVMLSKKSECLSKLAESKKWRWLFKWLIYAVDLKETRYEDSVEDVEEKKFRCFSLLKCFNFMMVSSRSLKTAETISEAKKTKKKVEDDLSFFKCCFSEVKSLRSTSQRRKRGNDLNVKKHYQFVENDEEFKKRKEKKK